jgi:colanic acid biosynthesis glycosyl transferase WcaI
MGDLATDLKARGHDVLVITTVPHYNKDNDALAAQPLHPFWGKLLQRSDYCGMKILHTWMPRKGRNKLVRFIAWLGFHVISTTVGIVTRFEPDIILTPSPPLTIGVSAWLLAMRHHCPFVYNVQEVYPDVAVNLGMIRSKFVIKLLRGLERLVYAKARILTVISETMADHIRAKGVPEDKIRVVPNFVDIDGFFPLPKINRFSLQHELHDRFVVSYAGNMGKPQGLDTLLKAADLLRYQSGISFLLMGDGSERVPLMKQAERLRLPNILVLPYQPYSLMAEAYATADASFVSQAPGTSSDGIPSKVYRIMACARAVIACTDPDSDLARLVNEADGGVVVPSGDALALSNAIQQAYLHREPWIRKGINARDLVLREYSRSKISGMYDELITRLVGVKEQSPMP